MALTEYIYSAADDTANGVADTGKLNSDVKNSAITTALEGVNISDDEIKVIFKAALTAGEKTTLDGIVALHDGEPIVEVGPPVTSHNIPIVALVEPEGEFLSYVSHNWCDRHSWYGDAAEVTGQLLTLDTGTTYDFPAADKLVYLQGGRIMDEDIFYQTRQLVVKDNGTVIDPDDYTVDAENGTVTLDSAPAGAVTADYWKESGSTFCVKPSAGQEIVIRRAEVQFSTDLVMTPLSFEIWAYNPLDLPNKVLIQQRLYKSPMDIISVGNLGQGVIPKFGGLQNDVHVFPFDYSRPIRMRDSQGVEMRISIIGDTPMTGEWATVTLYAVQESEDA